MNVGIIVSFLIFWGIVSSALASKSVYAAGYAYNANAGFSVASYPYASSDFLVISGTQKLERLEFSQFSQTGKPLTIRVAEDSPLETLVITAPNMKLNSKISVVGKMIDVVFATSSTSLTCQSCSFDNMGRVTLLNGTFTGTNLNSGSTGKVDINNLFAPGVQSLEIIAKSIVTAGVIDTNLRAERHPRGGFSVSSEGSYIVGAGGINLYPGRFSIKYSNLDILTATSTTVPYTPGGIFKAASIGIVAAGPVSIGSQTELNTLSDALATSTRLNDFYAPNEGIFVQIAKSNSGSVTLSGKLYSDHIVTVKNRKAVSVGSSAHILSSTFKVLTEGTFYNYGRVESSTIELKGSKVINFGQLTGQYIEIDSDGDVYNSFGGVMQAGAITATLKDGIFTNGSRTIRLSIPSRLALKTPTIDVTKTKHGLYQEITASGSYRSNRSAYIHANSLSISAKAIENINPYSLNKRASESWDSGIKVNTKQANQVRMSAEHTLELKAKYYIRNASAIMALNQAGNFDVNTPKFYNERYRLEATTYLVSQIVYDPTENAEYKEVHVGTESKITAYSPPGRVISYGKLKVSDGNSTDADEQLVNAFSYFEVFGQSHFHQLELKSIGLELTGSIATSTVNNMRRCMLGWRCKSDSITTHAEAETLLSLQGNVYGLNEQLLSETDYTQENINIQEQNRREAIEEYKAQFIWSKSATYYSQLINIKAEGDWLSGTYKVCNGTKIISYVGIQVPNCSVHSFRTRISELVEEAIKDNLVGTTGKTHAQITQAALNFVAKLPQKNPSVFAGMTSKTYSSYALSQGDTMVTISYVEYGTLFRPGSKNENYNERYNETISLTTLMTHL
ncbi:hypothetical protein [Pseudoalteromonas rubra]|uniref:hypothetical protein n=1 Tax=Pseudoalteromonas rubra TaxID=43658 RepID=UPI000F7AD64D|nr:hypothetical protein [Pseudoalteromonas rubra]